MVALRAPRDVPLSMAVGDRARSRRSEASSRQKEKTLEQEGHSDDPSLWSASKLHGGWRLEMPIFFGENLDGWIFRAERYFVVNHLSENEKWVAAGVSFDGDTSSWLQWTEVRASYVNWADCKRRILIRVRPSQDGTLHQQFLEIRQEVEGTSSCYQHRCRGFPWRF